MRRDPAPAWGRVGMGLVLDFQRLPGTDRFDDPAQRVGIDATDRAGDRIEGRHLADPSFLLRDDAVGDRPQLGQVAGRVRFQKQGLEAVAPDVGAGALVVDHVARRHAEVAVQVGGCLVDRDPEGGHQVAAVDMAFPEEPELDELEPALNAPPNVALRWHLCNPVS